LTDEQPNSPESERVILGAILVDASLLEPIREQMTGEQFYSHSHRRIYDAIMGLREQGTPVDTTAVINSLRNSNELEATGGTPYVLSLPHGVPALVPRSHIKEVVRLARKRRAMQFAERFGDKAANGDETEEELLRYAQDWIDGARTELPNVAKVQTLKAMIDDQAGRYRRWHKGISDAIPTGFPAIDSYLLGGGLVRSGLYVLAARPGMGKTAMSLDIAANMAHQQTTVYLVSREMPAPSLFDRLHAAAAGVPRSKLRPGINKTDYERLLQTLETLGALPIAIDNSSLTVSDVRSNLREEERKQRRPEVIIIDYIQLLKGQGRNRNDEVGSVSRGLKALAMELNVPILALAQLSRECEKMGREPELSDLRDSGEIEQDADAVFFLFGDKPEEHGKVFNRWLKCSKQRDGQLFRTEVPFNGEMVTFRSFEQLTRAST
jgi:replicative DNA helicase